MVATNLTTKLARGANHDPPRSTLLQARNVVAPELIEPEQTCYGTGSFGSRRGESPASGADVKVSEMPSRQSDSVGLVAADLGVTADGVQIVHGVSLSARPGSLTAVIGPSGCGKTTVVRMLCGDLRPTTGTVHFDGDDTYCASSALRGRVAMVPQDDSVHRQLTVGQALAYGARLHLGHRGCIALSRNHIEDSRDFGTIIVPKATHEDGQHPPTKGP